MSIAKHPTVCRFGAEMLHCLFKKKSTRFSATALISGGVGTEIYSVDGDAMSGKSPEQGAVYFEKIFRPEISQSNPLLVGDHHEPKSGLPQTRQTFRYAIEKLHFSGIVQIGDMADQSAVTIKKNDALHIALRLARFDPLAMAAILRNYLSCARTDAAH